MISTKLLSNWDDLPEWNIIPYKSEFCSAYMIWMHEILYLLETELLSGMVNLNTSNIVLGEN